MILKSYKNKKITAFWISIKSIFTVQDYAVLVTMDDHAELLFKWLVFAFSVKLLTSSMMNDVFFRCNIHTITKNKYKTVKSACVEVRKKHSLNIW